MNTQESKERKFEGKVREKGGVVLMFIQLYLHFCYNQHQNQQVEVKSNVLIFFFHLKMFSLIFPCSFVPRFPLLPFRIGVVATGVALQKKFFLKFSNIHRKAPLSEPLFNKVAGLKAYNVIKKRLQYRCFPVNIAKF